MSFNAPMRDAETGGSAHYERLAMGSRVALDLHGGDPAARDHAWEIVSSEFERSEDALSRFSETSELTALNRRAGRGKRAIVGRRLHEALVLARRAQVMTGGRFDPRVLRTLESIGYRGAPVELDARGATAASGAAGEWLDWCVDRHCRCGSAFELSAPIDLGGIGKGLTLRWAWNRLAESGAWQGALLNAGGDIVMGGTPPEGERWRIGIEDPTNPAEPIAVVETSGGAVCTSATRINSWAGVDGELLHHLIDPATGRPGGEGLRSVTVAGPDPAWAEVWSKTLFLAGTHGIASLARSKGLAAWWVDADGQLEMTAAGRVMTIWTRGD